MEDIFNCYNTGKITSKDGYAGGIVADSWGYGIYNCYNIGEVIGNVVGSLVGNSLSSTISNCYYLSGTAENQGATLVNVEEIDLESLKTDTAIEFLNSNGYTSYKKDTKNVNNGYPIFNWQ